MVFLCWWPKFLNSVKFQYKMWMDIIHNYSILNAHVVAIQKLFCQFFLHCLSASLSSYRSLALEFCQAVIQQASVTLCVEAWSFCFLSWSFDLQIFKMRMDHYYSEFTSCSGHKIACSKLNIFWLELTGVFLNVVHS